MNIGLAVVGLILLAVVVVLGLASGKSDDFSVTRVASIGAAPEKVFPLINDFHAWTKWSPWERLDPNLKRTYSGAPAGVGAIYEWVGNKQVGQGRMEITQAVPSSRIVLDLHFIAPFEARNVTTFELVALGEGTQVTWSMAGKRNFMIKVMSVVMNMDDLIGKDFERGLANLKQQAETP